MCKFSERTQNTFSFGFLELVFFNVGLIDIKYSRIGSNRFKIKDNCVLERSKSLNERRVRLVFFYIVIPVLDRGEFNNESLLN